MKYNKYLDSYLQEFAGRNKIRDMDTIDMMRTLFRSTVEKRLTY